MATRASRTRALVERQRRNADAHRHPACSNDDELRGLPKRASARVTGAYLSEILPPAPKPGTPEWFEHEMKEMEEAAVERHLALEAERREADEWGCSRSSTGMTCGRRASRSWG